MQSHGHGRYWHCIVRAVTRHAGLQCLTRSLVVKPSFSFRYWNSKS